MPRRWITPSVGGTSSKSKFGLIQRHASGPDHDAEEAETLAGRPRVRQDQVVSLAQIRYFVAVAEEGHVGRAAARLRIAQPPVSRQIRALEHEIGAPLFTRTPRGMSLLPAGEAFLDHARSILAAVEQAGEAARKAATPSAPGECPVED